MRHPVSRGLVGLGIVVAVAALVAVAGLSAPSPADASVAPTCSGFATNPVNVRPIDNNQSWGADDPHGCSGAPRGC